jgi:uncharacterized protein (TIGR03083 family)
MPSIQAFADVVRAHERLMLADAMATMSVGWANMIDFDEALAANSRRFREVLAGLPDAARVPSCPQWSAADLLWHLTEVQSFWLAIVSQGLQTDVEVGAVTAPGRPVDREAAIALFEKVSFHLAMKLDIASDDDPVWTWTPNHTIGWVRRRQAQEALMHRVDAELTAGLPSEIDPELAEDGVDELLTQFGAQPPDWGRFDPAGMLVEVRCESRLDPADQPAQPPSHSPWLVRWRVAQVVRLGRFRGIDPSGRSHDEPDYQPVTGPHGPADAVLDGSAAELLLWLWGRSEGAGITVTGEATARAALREAIVANTQ